MRGECVFGINSRDRTGDVRKWRHCAFRRDAHLLGKFEQLHTELVTQRGHHDVSECTQRRAALVHCGGPTHRVSSERVSNSSACWSRWHTPRIPLAVHRARTHISAWEKERASQRFSQPRVGRVECERRGRTQEQRSHTTRGTVISCPVAWQEASWPPPAPPFESRTARSVAHPHRLMDHVRWLPRPRNGGGSAASHGQQPPSGGACRTALTFQL